RDDQSYRTYIAKRNSYFLAIKVAKQNLWDSFLENAKGKEVFKAFQYTKHNRVERIPVIKYTENGIERSALNFEDKSQAFLSYLFPKPPITDSPDWTNYRPNPTWEWPNLEQDEIKRTIFTSSTKSAPGPDRVSFKIVQQAYLAMPSVFY